MLKKEKPSLYESEILLFKSVKWDVEMKCNKGLQLKSYIVLSFKFY